jgi:hypothetical protein
VRRYTRKELDRLRRRRPGDALASLAAELGRTVDSLTAAIRWWKLPRLLSRNVMRDLAGAWRRMYRRGLNDAEAAARLGVAHRTVQRYRKKLGLPPIWWTAGSYRRGWEERRLRAMEREYEARQAARAV